MQKRPPRRIHAFVWFVCLGATAGCQVLFGAELPEEDATGAGAAGATAGGGTGGVGGSSGRAGVSGAGGTGGVSGVSGTGGVGGTSGTPPCKTCSEVGSGEKASEVCRDNVAPTSLELFDAAFLCTCDKCPASCANACDSKQLLATPACTTCQQTACADLIDACLADTPASRAGSGDAPGTAYDVLALGDGNKLYSFKSNDTANVKSITVSGVNNNTTLEGIDVRASDGLTYGLGSDGTLYKITISITGNGSATAADGKAVTALVLGEGGIAFDFNPASKLPADDMGNALRVIDGALNYRLNPVVATIAGTDTALTFRAGDANAGEVPNVVAAAYSNAFAGAAATVLYDIETGNDALVRQGDPDPNLGVLTTVGSLGITIGDFAGFDIVSNNAVTVVTNEAFLVTEGNFYKVDLGTGAATLVGAINGATALRGVSVTVPVP